MEKIQKEWSLYIKKILFKQLYDKNENKKVTDFLNKYNLLKVAIQDNEMEISFRRKDETVKMINRFIPAVNGSPWCYYWNFPKGLDSMELEKILDEFEFPSYFVGEEL